MSPLLMNEPGMDEHAIHGSNYGFSAKRIDELGASEYTLCGITADVSGSVHHFRDEIEMCVKEIVGSCRHSPRADNLMLRLSIFDNDVDEVHGFRPLSECDVDKYTGAIQIGGSTALYDAATASRVLSTTRCWSASERCDDDGRQTPSRCSRSATLVEASTKAPW